MNASPAWIHAKMTVKITTMTVKMRTSLPMPQKITPSSAESPESSPLMPGHLRALIETCRILNLTPSGQTRDS